MDFYQVHWYHDESVSPWTHDASYWQLDKPIVIGEFYAYQDHSGVPAKQLCKSLKDNGYKGAWAWQWYDGDPARQGALDCIKNVP